MSEIPKPSRLLAGITLPPQELSKLTFCVSNKASAVKTWVESLKATKVMQTSGLLYKALPDIPRLKTDYQNRFELLEIVRPAAQYSILGLQKNFLNQPLIMPEEAQKAVVVAQSIQKSMIDGYIATVVQVAQKGKANQATFELLTQSIHRAISGIGLLFFRNYQIYSYPPVSFWHSINTLYLVARYYDLNQKLVKDTTLNKIPALSIDAVYARVLMLATAKTNQMSQKEIDSAFNVFEDWCQSVKLNQGISEDIENYFAINMLTSQGPLYKSKIEDKSIGVFLEIDFKPLLSQLTKQTASTGDIGKTSGTANVPKGFPDALLNHLIETWSNVAQRKFDRKSTETPADVCVGLSSCHYFICNGQEFEYFLSSTGTENTLQKISSFSRGLTPAAHLDDHQNADVPVYKVSLQNASSGGYCMLWREDISSKVCAGGIIGVKEAGRRTWSIGVIRWVRQLKNASQLGVQLLSNNAKPYGISQTYDLGGYSEPMRALFLPPSKFGQGNPTILTASAPFQEYDKVRIIDGEREWSAKLDRQVFATKSIQQFRFRKLDAGTSQEEARDDSVTEVKKTSNKNDFDSNWD